MEGASIDLSLTYEMGVMLIISKIFTIIFPLRPVGIGNNLAVFKTSQ